VTISKDYYLGVYEVTQAQYEKMMGKNPSRFQGDNLRGDSLRRDSTNHPVEQVSWADAVEFCKTLSELPEEKKAGRVYRLPTEAEWEYACGAGTRAVYSFFEAQSLGDYAWFRENSHEKSHPVGQKKANAWGLHDMYGNVWEWCNDWHGKYPKGTISDPTGPKDGSNRVGRGGSWCDFAFDCRRAPRYGVYPSIRDSSGGFRVALSPSAIPQ
jgi:formylglycine-generating enzyme required for sulfatase activity